MSTDSRASSEPKIKKHKHKKQKREPMDDDSTGDLIISEEMVASSPKPKPVLLKPTAAINVNNKKRKKRDSASSEEERWLTAIESGKLEDVDDELKKIKPKDPALMTARQRAMYDRGIDGSPGLGAPTLMSLPTGYKEKVMTAEAIQKAAIKSQKRKQLADEKREKDKKKTMERLLKKQESKVAKLTRAKTSKNMTPTLVYQQNVYASALKLPPDSDYPLKLNEYKLPEPKYCSMGCGNLRKYCCSKTGVPLCSLECYKKNIANRIL